MSLEDKIRKIVDDVTGTKFVGRIEIHHEDDLYTLRMGMDYKTVLIVLGFQGNEDGFLKYVEDEIRKRKPQMREHHKTILVDKKSPDPSPVIEL